MNKIFYFLLLLVISLYTTLFAPTSFASKPTTITVMTFNIENGGTQVDFNKVVEAIRISKADVVGIQEACGNIEKIAKALNWKYFNDTQQIVSRFPLIKPIHSQDKYIFIEVAPGKVVAMANTHLPDEPYGPTLLSEHASVSATLENERKVRLPTAFPLIKELSFLAKKGMPVFLTGDFNSPSDLDWTAKTLNVLSNHQHVVPWPVTKTAADFGLKDSFRSIYSDPVKIPGYTWPAGRPFLEKSIDGFNPSNKDLPERIDFIFFGGKTRVLQSHIVGESASKYATLHISPWPSDHAAVVSTFEID